LRDDEELARVERVIFGGFHGSDGRAWMLREVRNTCYTWLERNRPRAPAIAFDDDQHRVSDPGASPLNLALQGENVRMLHQAIEQLSPEYREAIVLRELEELSYKEIVGPPSRATTATLDRAI
jgi:RNA polymerase sigma-70 factor (ECF subfamily)